MINYLHYNLSPPEEPLPDFEDSFRNVHSTAESSRQLGQPLQGAQEDNWNLRNLAHRPIRYDTAPEPQSSSQTVLSPASQHRLLLSLLDILLSLIDELWPASRRIMGIKVCYTLRSCLLSTNKVTLVACDREYGDFSPPSAGQMDGGHMATFYQFRSAKIHLISRGTGRSMIHSLARAMDCHGCQVYSLTLSGEIGDEGLRLLANSISLVPYLTCIDLEEEDRWPACRSQPWWHTSSFLQDHPRSSLSRITLLGLQVLFDTTRYSTGLLTLCLAEQPLYETGATALAEGMQHWPNLCHLNIDNTGIRARGAQALFPRLRSTLTLLSLTHNTISGEGLLRLAERIQNLPLVHLNLSGNFKSMQSERIVTDMSTAIADCPTLTWLDLSSTGLRDTGATLLAQGLTNGCVRSLFVGYNDLSGAGIRQMARIARLVTSLDTLSIANTEDEGDGATWWGTWLGPEPIGLRTLDWRCVTITLQGATGHGGLSYAL